MTQAADLQRDRYLKKLISVAACSTSGSILTRVQQHRLVWWFSRCSAREKELLSNLNVGRRKRKAMKNGKENSLRVILGRSSR